MDPTLLAIGGVVALALVFVLVNRRVGWIKFDALKGIFSASTRGEGANITRAKSRKGAIIATDETGSGANIKDVEAEEDIRADVKGGGSSPKP